ncbi:amidohydrolase family protein [Sphingomonas sp. CL5.1]|uniref:amidohydrolase family protein n=1 Tax=Sphingomonas sp. CL5.1 TaxID=2653203 RepID=UPI001583DC7C|nr:amidohydrolase family protein [Sphingomonas sp. CL5.1]QKS01669.1 amidohydrolase family protein [Sphingomonas sp. CL5.1]
MKFSSLSRSGLALLVAGGVIGAGQLAAAPGDGATAIVGATVFDGTGAAPQIATVVIRDGRIAEVTPGAKAPRGAKVIDARGKALLPGFYDLHTHWTPAGEPNTTPQIATDYVRSGVTTVNDFHEQPESYAPRREWLKSLVSPHVNFAARISTPGGHGADWGDQSTTIWINTPTAARAAIERLKPYKPDLIKAFTDGWRYGMAPDNTSMDGWTLHALTDAAHKAGWKVLTHTVTVDRGVLAARSGVDSLAHDPQDRDITPDEVKTIVASRMAVIPTLAVYDPDKGGAKPDDPRYRQGVIKFGHALHNVKVLFDAGVPIGVGTDAGMPATPHGSSTLHELELLVRAGLTPSQALVAATRTSAQIMAQDADRGTIAPGKRADLVLIDGKPWEQIADVHKVSQVMIDGRLVFGPGAPALPEANRTTHMPVTNVAALVDDFERPDKRSTLDTLRLETGDGGIDRSVEITQVVPRSDGGHALQLAARMAVKDGAYAGFAVPLTRGSVQPVDVRRYKGVRFDIKGSGDFALRLNGLQGSWSAPVKGAVGWTSIEVPFSALQPVKFGNRPGKPWSGDDIVQVEVGGTRPGGETMTFTVDNIRFY